MIIKLYRCLRDVSLMLVQPAFFLAINYLSKLRRRVRTRGQNGAFGNIYRNFRWSVLLRCEGHLRRGPLTREICKPGGRNPQADTE